MEAMDAPYNASTPELTAEQIHRAVLSTVQRGHRLEAPAGDTLLVLDMLGLLGDAWELAGRSGPPPTVCPPPVSAPVEEPEPGTEPLCGAGLHRMTDANTYVRRSPGRNDVKGCRKCRQAGDRRRRNGGPALGTDPDLCGNKRHAMTPENTRTRKHPDGRESRVCKACERATRLRRNTGRAA